MTDSGRDRLDAVEDVKIDDDGVFKYVLIKVHTDSRENPLSKHIVRGNVESEYHADIYDPLSSSLSAIGLDTECEGGGRIKHDAKNKTILVYGYSVAFGRADHSIAVDLLKKKYPGYKITFSNDGY